MSETSLRVLVVEDDFILAERLAKEIRARGDHVVGPFADVHEAIHRVGLVQAAILDVEVRGETSFSVADSLRHGSIPFVFLTGHDRQVLPARFDGQNVYTKPSHAGPLLDHLHRQHALLQRDPDDDIDMTVMEMMHKARTLMPSPAAADRLVETVLRTAIAETKESRLEDEIRPRLLTLLAEEYQLRGRRHLN